MVRWYAYEEVMVKARRKVATLPARQLLKRCDLVVDLQRGDALIRVGHYCPLSVRQPRDGGGSRDRVGSPGF